MTPPIPKFFTATGPILPLAGPWKRHYLIDSQMLIALSVRKPPNTFPLSHLYGRLVATNDFQEISPWFAAFELSKQHHKLDVVAYREQLLRLGGPNHLIALYATEHLSGILEACHEFITPELNVLSALTVRLYSLVDAIDGMKSLNKRRDLLSEFLSENLPHPNNCHGLDVYLPFLIVSGCSDTRALIKLALANKAGREKTATNVAWDFIFLKALHLGGGLAPSRGKTVLVTGDKGLQTLVSNCRVGKNPTDRVDGNWTFSFKCSPPAAAAHYLSTIKPYVRPDSHLGGKPL